VILACGCFDGLSAPHVKYLEAAKRLAPREPLVVTIVPDSYIRARKGRDPYWPQADRAVPIQALRIVDRVHLQPEGQTVPDVIRLLSPKYFVKGPEWDGTLDQDHMTACVDAGAEIRFTRNFGKHWSHVRA
jgi:glycerol-3-phosphate cytidylyltransferase-like family protein